MTGKIVNILKKYFRWIEIACVFAVCAALLSGAFLAAAGQKEILLAGAYSAFAVICAAVTWRMRERLYKAKAAARIAYVMALAFAVRFFVLFFLNLTQGGDYGVYLSIARKISSGSFTKTFYYGVFPHALNYPIFISGLYRLASGSLPRLPQLVNLTLGVLEAGCAAAVAEISVHRRFGLFAGLAAALNPCMIIFTLFAGGEPVYGALIMAALLFFIRVYGKNGKIRLLYAAFSGLACALANFFRPTGIIFIIAAFIVLAVFDKNNLKAKLALSAVLIVSYAAAVFFLGWLTSSVSGYEKPSPSYGWNLFIGANKESKGTWNAADAELFNEKVKEYEDPSELQSYFAGLGMERYREMKKGLPAHFINKIALWFDESFITNSVTGWQNDFTRFQSGGMAQTYKLICYFYNLSMIFGAMAAMIHMETSKETAPGLKLASLYMLGSVLIFLVLEFSSRYKGAYYGILTLLGAYGIYILRARSPHRN